MRYGAHRGRSLRRQAVERLAADGIRGAALAAAVYRGYSIGVLQFVSQPLILVSGLKRGVNSHGRVVSDQAIDDVEHLAFALDSLPIEPYLAVADALHT